HLSFCFLVEWADFLPFPTFFPLLPYPRGRIRCFSSSFPQVTLFPH
uniref:Uncharacterized protein n=1 Tax=Parascaris univalens TaxID=6257 RepID=A0A914ZYX7_PARUN